MSGRRSAPTLPKPKAGTGKPFRLFLFSGGNRRAADSRAVGSFRQPDDMFPPAFSLEVAADQSYKKSSGQSRPATKGEFL
jgi:hypothetical protein